MSDGEDIEEYERLFMQDAVRRAHDAELSALANLAMIRSNNDERSMMLAHMERERLFSPYEVRRRLTQQPPTPNKPDSHPDK